ncbi:MAG: flagellar basal body P-ring formation protein FlgA [Caulobacteraceae bacterium]|nr:flagellar basal body P-ring formation protein FlgA [Caulobacteraceae bacterium]
MTQWKVSGRLTSALAITLATLWATSALAAPVTLRANPTDADGKVTLGELFDGATGPAADVVVAARPMASVTLDAATVASVARRNGLDWANPTGLLRIVVRQGVETLPASAPAATPTAAPAVAAKGVDVLVYAASLNAGEVITADNLVWAKMLAAPVGALKDADSLIGKVAKRPLRAGLAASAADGTAPMVIKAGDTVAVVWSSGAVTVTLQAKALAPAAVGQSFNVQNPTSKKVIQAVALAPGKAVTGPDAQSVLSSALLASR